MQYAQPREEVIELITILIIIHHLIQLPILFLKAPPGSASGLGRGGAESGDQGGILDHGLLHGYAAFLKMGIQVFK